MFFLFCNIILYYNKLFNKSILQNLNLKIVKSGLLLMPSYWFYWSQQKDEMNIEERKIVNATISVKVLLTHKSDMRMIRLNPFQQ